MRLVVIGGSDAGISASLRARELDPACDVHLIVEDAYPNFSICGLPFYLSGEVVDWRDLAHRTREQIEGAGITLHLEERAIEIDASAKRVLARTRAGVTRSHSFDRLVIATGAVPVRPRFEGIDLPNVFVLHTMEECFAVYRQLEGTKGSAAMIGAGYIGLEMADALRHRGMDVTLIEQLSSVMRTVDAPVAARVEALLRTHGVDLRTSTAVEAIRSNHGKLVILCAEGREIAADFALVVVGVRPMSDLAKSCGAGIDEKGAILVDRGMRTTVPDIFAAGDCAVTWHRLLERDVYIPLGTTAHKQGRIAGENAVGGNREFAGTLGTQAVKLFDRVVAATGLRETDARAHGFNPLAVEITTFDHKKYYPGATEMIVRLVGDATSGQLLGAQIVGAYGKEVSKRIDSVATALYHRMQVEALNDLDLSYTPPLSSPWDPIQMAAQAWAATWRARRQ